MHGMTYSIEQTQLSSRSIYQSKNHLYRICFVQAQKAPIEKHIHELDRSPKVMNILTFATRLNMETYRRQQAHSWVEEEIFDKVQDKGILVSSNLRWIQSSIGCYLSLQYRMQREYDALLQGELLQKISEFDMVRQDGQLPDGPRLYQE